MMSLVKKSAYVSLGLAVLSASAIKRLGQKIAEESKLSEAEGKKLIEDLLEESEKSKSILSKKVEKTVKKSIVDMDVATSTDIESINKRLDEIEKNMSYGLKTTKTNSSSSTDKKKI
jgi:polyhydroxyalkanoate synthesis regulator phasin